jgi:ribosomal protein S18 acetylase RimI-like enzyme
MVFSNFERMIELAEDVFDVRNDANQLSVDEEVIERLEHIHPSTVSEFNDGNGPVFWILVIPTTIDVMNKFINRNITEQQLLDLTPLDTPYEAIYLCSAMVLPEFRNKGIAKRLTLEAIENIRKQHPIKTLFVWSFTKEGNSLAEYIARVNSLPLMVLQQYRS